MTGHKVGVDDEYKHNGHPCLLFSLWYAAFFFGGLCCAFRMHLSGEQTTCRGEPTICRGQVAVGVRSRPCGRVLGSNAPTLQRHRLGCKSTSYLASQTGVDSRCEARVGCNRVGRRSMKRERESGGGCGRGCSRRDRHDDCEFRRAVDGSFAVCSEFKVCDWEACVRIDLGLQHACTHVHARFSFFCDSQCQN